MPGILEEGAGGRSEEVTGRSCKAPGMEIELVQDGARSGESLTPSPGLVENFVTSDSGKSCRLAHGQVMQL